MRLLDEFSPDLLEAGPEDLSTLLGGPTLVHIKATADARGRYPGALFVCVLLHGNETSGWAAVQRLLRDHPRPVRDIVLFIGNVEAAAQGVRTLPGQKDFNRMWRNPEGLAREVLRRAAAIPLFAVVDLHNNTGKNPHYSVLTDFTPGSLGLAALFCDTAVYIREPATVLTRAFSPQTPSIALELGPASDPRAPGRAYDYLRRLINLESIPEASPTSTRLYRTLARVHLREGIEFGFTCTGADPGGVGDHCRRQAQASAAPIKPANGLDVILDDTIEASNFARLPRGTAFGYASGTSGLRVLDNDHAEVTDRFFEVRDGRIVLKAAVVPAMYTTDPVVARQDCLCYFMEPLAFEPTRGGSGS